MTTTFELLLAACGGSSEHGAIRIRSTYEPVGGFGSKVFPPTYAIEDKYVREERFVDGAAVEAVVLDAVQSQANRVELALLDAAELDGLDLPYLTVAADIDGTAFRVTNLDAPHRGTDAYFRDAQYPDGTAFDDSEVGAALLAASERQARPLFENTPTDLLFGIWNSQRRKRGLRLPRAYTSEIVALEPREGKRAAGRLDTFNLQAGGIFYDKDNPSVWSTDPAGLPKGVKGTKGRPSHLNHGNALASPDNSPGGFAVRAIERVAVISFGVLGRLRFPLDGGPSDPDVDAAGRAVLAALGLLGDRLAFAGPSVFLRSGCDLLVLSDAVEFVGRGGATVAVDIGPSAARALYEEAATHAASLGLRYATERVVLEPKPNLRELLAINFAAASTNED